MRRAISRTRLKQRRAKKSTPCLIQKFSRCAADRTSKQRFLSFTFYKTQRSYEKIMCLYFLFHWFSGENCMFFFLYIRDDRLKKNEKET